MVIIVTPEKHVENSIKRQLANYDAYTVKNFGGAHTKKGIPDIFSLWHGHFLAIEVKRLDNGAPTPVQLRHLKHIAEQGGIAVVTSDPDFPNHWLPLITDVQLDANIEYLYNTRVLDIHAKKAQPLFNPENIQAPARAKQLWQWTTKPHTLFLIDSTFGHQDPRIIKWLFIGGYHE